MTSLLWHNHLPLAIIFNTLQNGGALSASCHAVVCSCPDGPNGSVSVFWRNPGVFVPSFIVITFPFSCCPPCLSSNTREAHITHVHLLMASEATHTLGNFSQHSLGISCESVWQIISSTVRNTETNDYISSLAPSLHSHSFPLPFLSLPPSLSLCRRVFPLSPQSSWTSSLPLHRWFQWLLWVLIIPSITVGKCAIKVDSYCEPRGSVFNSVTPDFRGFVPALPSPLGRWGASCGS